MTLAGRAAFQRARGTTVKTSLKYAASLLSATAIVSVIGFAPIAAAATHTVLTNTGADPFVLLPPGDGLAF
jgi:hypothetical protein